MAARDSPTRKDILARRSLAEVVCGSGAHEVVQPKLVLHPRLEEPRSMSMEPRQHRLLSMEVLTEPEVVRKKEPKLLMVRPTTAPQS